MSANAEITAGDFSVFSSILIQNILGYSTVAVIQTLVTANMRHLICRASFRSSLRTDGGTKTYRAATNNTDNEKQYTTANFTESGVE
jgi:hypothetical protein